MDISSRLFICYSEFDSKEAKTLEQELSNRFHVTFRIHNSSELYESGNQLSSITTEAINKSELIVLLLSGKSIKDTVFMKAYKLASQLNKTILPVIVGRNIANILSLRIKANSNFSFRSNFFEFNSEESKIQLFKEINSILGLNVAGDVYGSMFELTIDNDSLISKDNEPICKARANEPFKITLKKGSGSLTVQGENMNIWNRYKYSVPDNDSIFQGTFSIRDLIRINRSDLSELLFDPNDTESMNRDIANLPPCFSLDSSSEDARKSDIAIASFTQKYRAMLKPRPLFRETLLPDVNLPAVAGLCILVCFNVWGKLLWLLLSGFIYCVSFKKIDLFSSAWLWLTNSNFYTIIISIGLFVFFILIWQAVIFVVSKYDDLRHKIRLKKDAEYNKDLYERLNSMLHDYQNKRNLANMDIPKIYGQFP